MQLTTIGLDIAKNVFQVHGVDRQDKAGLRKRLSWGSVLAFFANLPPGLNRAGGLRRRALLGAEAARARARARGLCCRSDGPGASSSLA
jgi:hypothetical protein